MTSKTPQDPMDNSGIEEFRSKIFAQGIELYRDLPWRRTRDPYAIWISEVMLQQTQVSRVDGRWQKWLDRFPTVDVLAQASSADVLDEWQGLGYNRRALALMKASQAISENHGGILPSNEAELTALPGIGPATAAGIRAFAFDLAGVYLETNVRTVVLYELFPNAHDVPDSVLIPLVRDACPKTQITIQGISKPCSPRSWYYALLDYGAHLKKTVPNPSRRSRSNTRQSRFEGSHRQKRALVVRLLLAAQARGCGVTVDEITDELNKFERSANRGCVHTTYVEELLSELKGEGFCHEIDGIWMI